MIYGNDLWPNKFIQDMKKIKVSNRYIETYENLPNNLYDVLLSAASTDPDKIAIIDNYDRKYSYSKIVKLVDQFSSYLYNIAAVQRGSHVALMLYNSIEFCVAYLSLSKLGAVTIPLPSKYKKNEVKSLAGKSDLDYIICDENFYEWFVPFENKGISTIKATNAKYGYGFAYLSVDYLSPVPSIGKYEDTAIIMFTSGTTSQSKGVIIKNYNIMHAIVSYQRILGITKQDKTIIPIPIYHITGLVALLGLFLYCKGTIYLHKFFNAQKVLSCVKENNITFIHASPTVFLLLLQEANHFPVLPSLRAFACGSSNMPIEKLKLIRDWLPHICFHTVYGLTETTSPATIFPTNAAESRFIGSSGKPIPGTTFKIIDDDDHELPNNAVGEVTIKGSVVLDSYFNMASTSLDNNGWLKTGDLGYFNEEGYLFIVDRKKDMINRGGEKIWSFELENEIYKIDGVEETAVVGIPDEIYGEVAAAVIRLEDNFSITKEEIQTILKTKLAKYKLPQYIKFLHEIPKTPNDKVDKKKIRKILIQEEMEC